MRRLAALLLVSIAGCMPPPVTVGYVSMSPSRAGGVDLQGQGGGGGALPAGGGGGGAAMGVEPFVTRTVSIPIGAGLGGSSSGGHSPFRFGVRHRAARIFAYGFGIGPSVNFDEDYGLVSGVADVELVLGTQGRKAGFSLATRPALSFTADALAVYLLAEPTLAIRLVGRTSLTLALPFGGYFFPQSDTALAYMSGAMGIHRRF